MMVLSRFWYLLLAVFAAASFYALSLAVGQYNRRGDVAMEDGLKSDTQVVSWALQIDSRRRLDALLLGSVDEGVRKALRGAAGKDTIPAPSRDEGKKALTALGEHLPADYRFDALFAVDREGRVLAASGYDDLARAPDMELGGYPAVFDALHGYSRDDLWSWGGKLARVAARPVEDEIGQAPIGAIVGLQWVDQKYAADLAKRTHADVLFYADNARVASGVQGDALDTTALETLVPELAALATDADYSKGGRSSIHVASGGRMAALYAKLPGDAIAAGAGFAVVRTKTNIAGPLGFLTGADDRDKASVMLWLVGLVALLGFALGLLFTFLEHSRPLGELGRQATALRSGQQAAFQLPKLASAYRAIGNDVNQGLERLAEQGGGATRKPADLEAILGPVPAQPQMSAFSFPQADAVPAAPSGQSLSASASGPLGLPVVGPAAARPPLPGRPGAPQPPAPKPPPPAAGSVRSFATAPLGASPKAAPAPAALAAATMVASSTPDLDRVVSAVVSGGHPAYDDDDETKVGRAPTELIAAASKSLPPPGSDTPPEWKQVYEEFVATKKQCGESVEGLTFDKFVVTLRKNRDALVARHNCSRVRFAVYVKDGRASLKATPVRD